MTIDMFAEDGRKPRRKPRVLMHVSDAGIFPDGKKCIRFECSKCGYDTGHIYDERSVTENKRGIPCPECNQGSQKLKKLKLKDTRGVEHSISADDVDSFETGVCPLKRPCVKVVCNGELIFADCELSAFVAAWDAAAQQA